ncbi:GTPase IMAP family member 4-like [Scleropages formosus]|uniref:GTPase IMAP family member 4-like n=1 Tax=Scleropages formosus TaxID=113540 RepID=A0A0P7V2Q3_SCLFO|nr:GTPase IMAP family member 4-like [Scleropages formosus]
MLAPGPHAVLLVMQIGRYTEEENLCVERIQTIFSRNIVPYTILLLTHADKLKGQSIEDFIAKQNRKIQDLVKHFGRRFLAFNNEDRENRYQVAKLLEMINRMVNQNENSYFTNEVFKETNEVVEVFQREHLELNQEEIRREKLESKMKWNENLKQFIRKMQVERWKALREKAEVEDRMKVLKNNIAELDLQLKEETKKLKQLEVEENNRKKEETQYRRKIEAQIRQEEEKIDRRYFDSSREEAEQSPELLKKVGLFVAGAALLAAGVGIGTGATVMMSTASAAPAAAASASFFQVAGPAAVAAAQQAATLVAAQCSIQ